MMSKIPLSFVSCIAVVINTNCVLAQIYQPSNRIPITDTTLGTQLTGSNGNFNVTGGLNLGQNVFHSFQDFSVPTGGSVTFNGSTGTQAIITRVSGNLFSDINGVVNTQGANFFLINPNGIVFGPQSQLNVGKAFVATTATSASLVDGNGNNYTFGTRNINDAPLLSVNPSVALNLTSLSFSGNNAEIVNYGNLQTNNSSQYIALIGGNITLDAEDGKGNIFAPGGRVDLGGLSTAGTVSINSQGFVYGGVANNFIRNDISIIDGARVDVTTTQTVAPVSTFFFNNAISGGSSINIDANNVRIFNRERVAVTPGVTPVFREPIAGSDGPGKPTNGEGEPDDKNRPLPKRVTRLANENRRIIQSCEAGSSKFTIVGRGGLPSNALEPLNSDVVWQDQRSINKNQSDNSTSNTQSTRLLPPPAIGWILDEHGKIALLAANSDERLIEAKNPCQQRY